MNSETDFDHNGKSLLKTMDDYVKQVNDLALTDMMNKIDSNERSVQFIFDYVDNLTPQHRCNGQILKLILAHGTLLSRKFQEEMTQDPKKACLSLSLVSPLVTLPIMQSGLSMKDKVKKWIKALVNYYFDKSSNASLTPVKCTLNLTNDVQKQVETIIENIVTNVKGHSITGIGYPLDVSLGTNQQVFSIVGVNTAKYYGEVLFILDRKIMLHPDFNMSLEAATHYCSKKVRPWRSQEALTNALLDGVQEYKSAKLHPSSIHAMKVMAKDIVLFHYDHFKTVPKDQVDLLKASTKSDAHNATEGHLPPVVPVSYVSHIVMSKATFDTLSSLEQKILIDIVLKKKERLHFCPSHQDQLNHVMKNSLYLYSKMNKLKDKMMGRGLTFSIMYQFGQYSLLPQLILHSKSATLIELTVRGKNIGICFSPSKTIDPQNSIFVLLNRIYFWKTKYSTPRTSIQRGNDEKAKKLASEKAFTGEGNDHMEMYIKFKIYVSSKQISIQVASENPNTIPRNSLKADISKLSLPQPLTFIHFSNWSSLVEVKWISVDKV